MQRGAPLRHRRRGRFDPGRRGAHAADHQRPERRQLRALPGHRQAGAPAAAGDWEKDEKQRSVSLTEQGQEHIQALLAAGRPAEGAGPLRHRERQPGAPRPAGAARAQGVRPRRRLHRQGRQGHHHRRVHRPHDGGPALLGRAAPGARGQGAVPIQAENQTLASITFQNYFRLYKKLAGMTGTARDRGRRVRRDLPAGRDRDPDPPRHGPQGRGRRGLPHRAREERGDHRGDPGRAREGAAGPGRHGLDREVRASVRPAQGQGPAAPGAQRPLPRAGGATSSRRPAGSAR